MLRFITWFVGVNYNGGEMVPIRVFSPLPVRTLLSPETKKERENLPSSPAKNSDT